VSADLADPASRSPLRRTRPGRHQTIKATAYVEDDSATPKSRLSDRTTESCTKPSTRAVIFDPASHENAARSDRDSGHDTAPTPAPPTPAAPASEKASHAADQTVRHSRTLRNVRASAACAAR